MRAERLVVAGAILVLLAGMSDVLSAPVPAPTPAPRRFEGVERRTPGFVLFGQRWVPGVLTVKDGTVSWADGGSGRKNVLLPVGAVVSQSISCPPPGSCTWTVRTRRTDFVFREGAQPPPGGGARAAGGGLREAFATLLELRTGLPSAKDTGGK